MLVWFITIGVLGLAALARHPAVLVALSPTYAASFLIHGGWASFLVLGAVFLCVTGAEALYADMGHFGAGPIRARLVCCRLPEPHPELCRAGRACGGGRRDRQAIFSTSSARRNC